MPDCEILNTDSGCDLVVDYSIGDARKDRKHDDCDPLHWKAPSKQNDSVHRAAANDIDFRNRAARGSVCNGLLLPVFL
jgi:hypothetical protein